MFTGALTLIVFLPLAGVLLLISGPWKDKEVRYIAGAFTLATFGLALTAFFRFDLGAEGLQFVEQYEWIPGLGIKYFMGVDGLSMPMVLLTALIFAVATIASWSINLRVKEYFIWIMLLETGVMGVFTSQDFIQFFLFWEVEVAPMFFLISIWGTGRKEYSAMKFLIYTLGGSAFMLVGILVLGFSAGTFDMVELASMELHIAFLSIEAVFFLIFVAFAVKLPVWPLHTWLPDAHTDAPTAVSVILAGILLKMGGYGFIRISLSIFPEVAGDFAWFLVSFAVVNILYGAVVTIQQKDMKRLIAFSSISHMGFVLLGVGSLGEIGVTGAALQMFTHGTITGLLFLLVGLVYDKTHTRYIPDLKGLVHRMPITAVVFAVAGLAALGIPSMSGFASELLVFLGTFPEWRAATILGVIGIVLTAGYILWMIQRVFFGPSDERFSQVGDVIAREMVPLAPMVGAIFLVGIYPAILTDMLRGGIVPIISRLG
ncbi:MAG: NADH-quinone oxidoreductase subunit M [Dehalococcoidia bacterium]